MSDTINIQASFWDDWNAAHRERSQSELSLRQRREIVAWLDSHTPGRDLAILDVGCGAGWMTEALLAFGSVTGTDLSASCLDRARLRWPQAAFIAGDFNEIELPEAHYDVVVSLEVLAHVADQPAFLAKIARLLKPGGYLMMATQNRPVLARWGRIQPPRPGNLRRWVDRKELRALLKPRFDVVELKTATADEARGGVMRWINAPRVRRVLRGLGLHGAIERLKERAGLGWTLLVLARRKADV